MRINRRLTWTGDDTTSYAVKTGKDGGQYREIHLMVWTADKFLATWALLYINTNQEYHQLTRPKGMRVYKIVNVRR